MRIETVQDLLFKRIQYRIFPMWPRDRLHEMCIIRNQMSVVSKAFRTCDESVFLLGHSNHLINSTYISHYNNSNKIHLIKLLSSCSSRMPKRYGVVIQQQIVLNPYACYWVATHKLNEISNELVTMAGSFFMHSQAKIRTLKKEKKKNAQKSYLTI